MFGGVYVSKFIATFKFILYIVHSLARSKTPKGAMFTARIFSLLLLCVSANYTTALKHSSIHCIRHPDQLMPSIASSIAAIHLMSNEMPVIYASRLRLGILSGNCRIIIQQTAGPTTYDPSGHEIASKKHIMWPVLQIKAADVVRQCFEQRRMSGGSTKQRRPSF